MGAEPEGSWSCCSCSPEAERKLMLVKRLSFSFSIHSGTLGMVLPTFKESLPTQPSLEIPPTTFPKVYLLGDVNPVKLTVNINYHSSTPSSDHPVHSLLLPLPS